MIVRLSLLFFLWLQGTYGQYEPTWDSLDARPLPDWYDKAKVGIFVHWGVYSVPSYGYGNGPAWIWWSWQGDDPDPLYDEFIKKNYGPHFTYQDFAEAFTAEFYNPDEWADLFQKSGAKYVVLTSKHHEGYALWPSDYSFSWNAMDVGPHRDLLGDLADAVRQKELHFGLYHSLYEWFNPLYRNDKTNGWNTSVFVDTKVIPQMKEVITKYEPDVLWSDGDWEAYPEYWKSTEFLAWLYNESPVKDVVVTNDRWGYSTGCAHGGFYTCADRYNPGHLMERKWENAMTIDSSAWGYRRNINSTNVLTPEELIATVAQTVSCGGNILINVGPTKEGTIIPIFQERLLQLGTWLGINGEAIYETWPWTAQNDTLNPNVWYTRKEDAVYAIILSWPEDNVVTLESAAPLFEPAAFAELLGNENSVIGVETQDNLVNIVLPNKASVVSEWAWVVKIVPIAPPKN